MAASAAEKPLVAPPRDRVDEPIAHPKLAELAAPEHRAGTSEEAGSGPVERHCHEFRHDGFVPNEERRDTREPHARDAQNDQPAQNERRVDPVIRSRRAHGEPRIGFVRRRRRRATMAVAATAMTSAPPSATVRSNVALPGCRLAMTSAKNTATATFGTMPSAEPAR